MVVIAPEHRDGSCPVSYIRDSPCGDGDIKATRAVDYVKISHTITPENRESRNDQIRIRLWELGLVHDSLLKLDRGRNITNLNTSSASMASFKGLLDVHEPGKITFAGHSFGAATVAQFIKSAFYATQAPKDCEPIFAPSSDSSIVKQITSKTPVILLDVWCLPLRAPSVMWLWSKPFPCYTSSGTGGSSLLAVQSQAFVKWREHFKATKRLLSPDPLSDVYDYSSRNMTEPHFYYPAASAHLNQSDFGILFPWVTRKVLSAEEPERVMRLNVRAVLQMLRMRGIEVGKTSSKDMEMELEQSAKVGMDGVNEKEIDSDPSILGRNEEVRGWTFLTTDLEELKDIEG